MRVCEGRSLGWDSVQWPGHSLVAAGVVWTVQRLECWLACANEYAATGGSPPSVCLQCWQFFNEVQLLVFQ